MLGTITQIDHDQLRLLLQRGWTRRITSVHVHHTWRPNHSQWRGQSTVEAIRRYHTQELGWSDIAEHLTLGPDGSLWTGRSLDRPPASAAGHNGTPTEGPFMIEMIGDFDIGRDVFGGDQAASAYRTIAEICSAFGLNTSAIRFHNEFANAKSCPGTSFKLEDFRAAVDRELAAIAGADRGVAPMARDYAAQVGLRRGSERALEPADAELDCNAAQGARSWDEQGAARGLFDRCTPEEIEVFRSHIVNLSAGLLSEDGCYSNTEADLDELLRRLDTWVTAHAQGKTARVMFFAHGGLVDEQAGLGIALRDYRWWLANDVYPVFFVWETGFLEVFSQAQPADPASRAFITDPVLELTLGPTVARPAWDRMKNSAFLSSSPTTGGGAPGGAFTFLKKLAKWHGARPAQAPAVEFHAVAHSAGAIFHCHFLPALEDAFKTVGNAPKPLLETLAFLAPAVRVDLFAKSLVPRVGKAIDACAMFTMQKNAERVDDVLGIYRKSLLYFVRNACERPTHSTPVLGLEESVRDDPALVAFFGLDAQTGKAQVIWSPTAQASGNAASRAVHHGAFDNDSPTMSSVMRRILGIPDAQPLPCPHLPVDDIRACSASLLGPRDLQAGVGSRAATGALARSAGAKRALCIGVDTYGPLSLTGCVADADAFATALGAWGFDVKVLTNERATRQAMASEIDGILGKSTTGDVVVIQYSGHGTQTPDLNDDEEDHFDEAWVPVDYATGEFLIDDDLAAIFDRHRSRGVQLVVFTDCCHSGTSTRFFPGPGAPETTVHSRYMEVPPDIIEKFKAKREIGRREARGMDRDRVDWEIHFAACQDRQSAYERNGHGDFTGAVTKALGDARAAPTTYDALHQAIANAFVGNSLQTPNFRALDPSRRLTLFATTRDLVSAPPGPLDARDAALSARIDQLTAAVNALTKKVAEL